MPIRAASSWAARRPRPRPHQWRSGSAEAYCIVPSAPLPVAAGPSAAQPRLIEAAGRVRQHGVDLAGFRGQIGARHHLAAVVARDLFEQPLKLADVAVDRLLELAVGAILA